MIKGFLIIGGLLAATTVGLVNAYNPGDSQDQPDWSKPCCSDANCGKAADACGCKECDCFGGACTCEEGEECCCTKGECCDGGCCPCGDKAAANSDVASAEKCDCKDCDCFGEVCVCEEGKECCCTKGECCEGGKCCHNEE